MRFNELVYEWVCKIPRGTVATYGQIAALCGYPRKARQVGWALHANPRPGVIPCHRVLFRDGRLCEGFAFGGIEIQRQLLTEEGVAVDEQNRVDLAAFRWVPPENE